MTNRERVIGILAHAASDGYNLDSRIETERPADFLISHGLSVGEGGYRKASEVEKETYDRMADTLWEEVEGWKKHFESLFETAKATLRAEVAREIFAEMEKLLIIDNFRLICNRSDFAELKKKYLEGNNEKNN